MKPTASRIMGTRLLCIVCVLCMSSMTSKYTITHARHAFPFLITAKHVFRIYRCMHCLSLAILCMYHSPQVCTPRMPAAPQKQINAQSLLIKKNSIRMPCHTTTTTTTTPSHHIKVIYSFFPSTSPPPLSTSTSFFAICVCANSDFGFAFPKCRPFNALSFCVQGLMIPSLGEMYFAPLDSSSNFPLST